MKGHILHSQGLEFRGSARTLARARDCRLAPLGTERLAGSQGDAVQGRQVLLVGWDSRVRVTPACFGGADPSLTDAPYTAFPPRPPLLQTINSCWMTCLP